MRCVLIYENRPEIRAHAIDALRKLLEVSKVAGISPLDIGGSGIRSNLFAAIPSWPSQEQISTIPLHIQCEEIEINEEGHWLSTLRLLVIDTVVI